MEKNKKGEIIEKKRNTYSKKLVNAFIILSLIALFVIVKLWEWAALDSRHCSLREPY